MFGISRIMVVGIIILLVICQQVGYSHEEISQRQEVRFCQYCGNELLLGIQHYCLAGSEMYRQQGMGFCKPKEYLDCRDGCDYRYRKPSYYDCEPGIHRYGEVEHYHLLKKKKR